MGIRTRPEPDTDRAAVLEELAGLRADVKALRTERTERAELNDLRDQVEKLKREKATLTEDNDRKIRETEHKVGLLKTKQDQDIAHAKRQTELEVREANLAADKDRFTEEMEFQRKRLEGEVERVERVLNAILERLPNITVELGGDAAVKTAA